MMEWQRTLNLLPEWCDARNGKIDTRQLAGVIASRLRLLFPFGDADGCRGLDAKRLRLAEEFADLAYDDDADDDEFDALMSDLYKWAGTHISGDVLDGKRACKIKTF